MVIHKGLVIVGAVLLLLGVVGCGATVPQEEYDLLAAEMATVQGDLTSCQEQVAGHEDEVSRLEAEAADAQSQVAAAEQELETLQAKIGTAAMSAEIMNVFLQAGFGGEEISEEEGLQIFLELSQKVEASGDTVLQEKFQELLMSFGDQEKALDLVEYLLESMAALDDE